MSSARLRPRRAFALRGHGVHGGRACEAAVRPAEWGAGLCLQVGEHTVRIEPAAVAEVDGGCTAIVCPGATVRTVEHLLAALVSGGVTDAIIQVEGNEIPILDGSARPWAEALATAGTASGPERVRRASRPVRVEAAGGVAEWTPGPIDEVAVHVAFADGPRGAATWRAGEPAPLHARTFVLERDIEAALAAGRGRGASPDNTWIHRPGMPGDEAVSHLLLDAIGDRALGGDVHGRAELWRPSHRLSRALWAAVLAE